MSHEKDEVQGAMEEEVMELIRDAQKRPITPDEAQVLLWHCNLPMRESRV